MVTVKTFSVALAAFVVSGGVASAAVATNDLNIHAKPGLNSQVVGVIPAGQSVAVLGCEGGWCKVRYGGRIGFASQSYLRGEARGAGVVMPGASVYKPNDAYAYDNGPAAGFRFPFGDNKW
jgi:uncharacterized protein YraI